MNSIEITGKTLKEATANAAQELGVAIDALNVTLLEETKGLFGKSVVRIRADVVEEAEPEVDAIPTEVASEDVTPVAAAGAEEEVTEAEQAVEASADDAEQFADLLREVLASAELEVDVKCSSRNGRYVNLDIDGRDVAFLVGKHGEVINALQYLVNIIASRKLTKGVRATLDGNNYRQRREEALRALSTKIAEQVRKRGEEAVLDALPAFERRIVHKALDGFEGVMTYSEGEEPNRRVVIAPAD
jgi:spoIIIJ-associated protein